MDKKKSLLYLLIIFIPTQLSLTLWPSLDSVRGIRIDYLAYNIYFTDLILFCLTAISLQRPLPLVRQLYQKIAQNKILCLTTLLWFAYHLLTAPNTTYQLYISAKFILWGNLFWQLFQTKLSLRIINYIFAAQVIFLAILAVSQILNQGSLGGPLYYLGERWHTMQTPGVATQTVFGQEYLRPPATFSHANTLSGYILVILVWQMISFHVQKVNLFLIILKSFVNILLIIACGSQAAFFTIIILVTTHGLKIIGQKIPLWIFGFIAFLVPIIMLFFNFLQMESITVRNSIFLIHAQALRQHWVTGMGWHGYFTHLSKEFTNLNVKTLQPIHNGLWFLIGSLGIPLFYLYLKRIASTTKKIITTPRYYPLVSIIILSSFDHYWITQPQTLLLAILITALTINPVYQNALSD